MMNSTIYIDARRQWLRDRRRWTREKYQNAKKINIWRKCSTSKEQRKHDDKHKPIISHLCFAHSLPLPLNVFRSTMIRILFFFVLFPPSNTNELFKLNGRDLRFHGLAVNRVPCRRITHTVHSVWQCLCRIYFFPITHTLACLNADVVNSYFWRQTVCAPVHGLGYFFSPSFYRYSYDAD